MSKLKKNETKERKIVPVCIPCPDPSILEVNSKAQYYDQNDFSSKQLSLATDQFNHSGLNRFFLHTYIWKPKHRCCQVLKAHIQVKMTSLTSAKSIKSSNAGNDGIAIVQNGGNVLLSEKVYSDSTFPIPKGEVVIKNFVLTGSQLNWLNSNNTLSFYVQDDTTVNWIKIRLEICCLKKVKRSKGRA